SLSSPDVGDWGMNTPGYFCIDQLNHQNLPPEIVNPVATIGEETNPERVFYVNLDSVFSDPDNADSQIEFALEFIENADLLTGTVVKGGNPNLPDKTMLSLNVIPEMTGETEVIISATSNGKKVYHSFNVVVQFPVAAELTEIEELDVYPNPFKSHLNINLPSAARKITLINQSGQVVYKKQLRDEYNIRLSDLDSYPAGVYILVVEAAGNSISRKVLKF
ncbi:MAG: T9SS type A sorting domain-containing protein, partial [Tangfeifania sp.]